MAEAGGLQSALAAGLEAVEPGLRILATDVLGLEVRVELTAADAHGRLVLVVRAAPGAELEGVANAAAQATFFSPRVADWLKLAPSLPLDPELAPRAWLVASEFGPRARAAAEASQVELICWPDAAPTLSDTPRPLDRATSPRATGFRTGLSEADLQGPAPAA